MGRVALITGCSSGIGLATAVILAKNDFTVYASMRDLTKKSKLEAAANQANVQLRIIQLDVTDDISVRSAVEEIMKNESHIDVLINNAGYGLMGPAECISLEDAKAEFDVNLFGLLRVTQAVLPLMRKQRSGHIINISSIAGLRSMPTSDLYNASKYAVEGLTEAMAPTLALMNIKMTLIEPGPVSTEFMGGSLKTASHYQDEPVYEDVQKKIFANREKMFANAQKPEEIAELIYSALTSEQPFRIQTSEWVKEMASKKYSNLDGRDLIDEYVKKLE